MDSIFGLNLLEKEKIQIPEKIKSLAEKREKARKEKNWKKADELRKQIADSGYVIEDSKKGYLIKKK